MNNPDLDQVVTSTILTHEVPEGSQEMTADSVRRMIDSICQENGLKIQVLRIGNSSTQADVMGSRGDVMVLQKVLPVSIEEDDDEELEVGEMVVIQ